MTNKNNSVKKARLGYLDLSFEGREEANRGGLDNGRRPHGGYKGGKKYPPSPTTIDKCKEYHRKLREDIEKLFEAELLEVHGSPTWSVEASREITHSGESPLFVHKYMSPTPTKVENPYLRFQRLISPLKCQKPLTSDGVLYYRPNRTHQFLTMTDVKNQTQNEVNLKYGRPTRTTLLRARQRTNSAPVNGYELRREMMKRIEDIRNNCYTNKQKESFNVEVEEPIDGEPRHAFLTGARYNRAHCMDAKGLTNYGVYMPRDNPMGIFVTGSARFRECWESPSAPPDSPCSDVDDMSSPMRQRPLTAPGYGRRVAQSAEKPRQAWTEKTENDVRRSISEEVLYWPKGFSIQGSRVPLKRTYSGPKLDDSILPSVQGFSVSRKLKPRESADDTSSGIQPPPSLHILSSKDDQSIHKHIEVLEVKKEEKPRKPKPILVDRSVNVPSVTSESGKWKDEPYIVVSAIGPQVKFSIPLQQPSKSDVCLKQSSNEFLNAMIQTKEDEHDKLNLKDVDEDMKSEGKESTEEKGTSTEKEDGKCLTEKEMSIPRVVTPATPEEPIKVTVEFKTASNDNEFPEEQIIQVTDKSSVNGSSDNVAFFITEEGKEKKDSEENLVQSEIQNAPLDTVFNDKPSS